MIRTDLDGEDNYYYAATFRSMGLGSRLTHSENSRCAAIH
jgi:hypothetical protein